MSRQMTMTAFVAMGLLMAGSTAAAQTAGTSGGQVTTGAMGRSTIESSKFTEYRALPNGVSVPFLNLWSKNTDLDFNLSGYNVRQTDQRYTGWLNASGMGLKFDYNQIPHNMGNGAQSMFNESAPGVWTASRSARQALQSAIDAKLPTSTRTFDFYNTLFTPTFASTNAVDVSGVRKTGSVELNVGEHLPFDMTLTFRNDRKEGYRGLSGGNFRNALSVVYEAAAPLDEVTNDFGLRLGHKFNSGNVYATFNRNLYNNRAETLVIDNMVQANDAASTSSGGGTSRDRFIMAPDNQASTGAAGFLLKFKYQTRISGGVSLSRRTQDAAFYPYTIDSLTLTPGGVRADNVAALPQKSYGGKVNTTMYNVGFSSRPIDGLGLRAQYRVYNLTDKSDKWIITGDMSQAQSTWNVVTPTTSDPNGHATANIYDTKSRRFNASATYDFGPLTVEGQVRSGRLERTNREALKGTESGWAVTGLFHANDLVSFRGTYDDGKRTVSEGETVYGYQMDEAPFTNKRTGIDVELTPITGLDLSFGYFRRNVEYTDRPNRTIVVSGVPKVGAPSFPNTPSGLLEAKYDSWTGEINYAPTGRVELGAYVTVEKDATTNQWSTTSSSSSTVDSLANKLNYAGLDKTNTYGANAVFQLVPDKHTLTLNAMSQKVNGLMDITANATGSFAAGRAGLNLGSGNAADIGDWDDTKLTTLSAQFDFLLAKAWTLSTGYIYEKYDFKDAFTDNNKIMTTNLIFLTKPNFGDYKASLVYGRLSYRF